MNAAEAAKIIKAIDGTHPVPQLTGIRGRMRFVGPIATRDMIIEDGKITVTPDQGKVDCTITAHEVGDNVRVLSGELQLVTALLQGRLEVEGDPMLIVRIAGSLRDLRLGQHLPTGQQQTTH